MLNLIVGDTGSGKTRFLNTLFNLGFNVANKQKRLFGGYWKVDLEQNGELYQWELEIEQGPSGNPMIQHEILTNKATPNAPLVSREEDLFKFKGTSTPKLSRENTSIELLKDEDLIKPLYDGFAMILRRDFSKDGLGSYITYEVAPKILLDQEVSDLAQLYKLPLGFNSRLIALKNNFHDLYEKICTHYLDLFPFIDEIEIKDLQAFPIPIEDSFRLAPIFSVKEKLASQWIPVPELASGMQKTLLILTDIYSLPDGAIYLIDEYENSLGVSVIDFLPDCLNEIDKNIQVIATSHHPYVINRIEVEDWIVFHRDGTNVQVRYGKDNVERYGKSKQRKFIQLLNDPFYNRGLE
jgi:AAA15 family ATPase/GTPase